MNPTITGTAQSAEPSHQHAKVHSSSTSDPPTLSAFVHHAAAAIRHAGALAQQGLRVAEVLEQPLVEHDRERVATEGHRERIGAHQVHREPLGPRLLAHQHQ